MRQFLLIPFALLFFTNCLLANGKPTGWLSLPESLVVTGCEQLQANDVRRALSRDRDIVFHTHPQVPQKLFCKVLHKRTLEGLWYGGFIQSEVEVKPPLTSSMPYVIEIVEGPRSKEAKVEVRGNSALSQEIIESTVLAKLQAGAEAFLQLDTSARQSVVNVIEKAYGAQGHLFTDITVSVEPEPATSRALVVIDVKDEGPRCLIGSLEIKGAKKNSEKDIKKLLDVEPSGVITSRLIEALEEKLFRSGRFLSHKVLARRPPAGQKLCVLEIIVKEYDEARPLMEENSRQEKAFLLVRDWFSAFPSCEQDLLFTAKLPKGWDLSGAVSPKSGLVFGLHRTGGEKPFEYRTLWTPQQVSILRLASLQQCTFDVTKGQLQLQLHMCPNKKPDEDNPFMLNAGFNFTTQKDEDKPPVAFDLVLAPVAFLSFPRTTGATSSVEGEILKLTAKRGGALMEFKVNEKSGRLLSLTVRSAEKKEEIIELSSTDGGFEVLKGVHERKAIDCKELSQKDELLASVSNFLSNIVLNDVIYGQSKEEQQKAELVNKTFVQPIIQEASRVFTALQKDKSLAIEFGLPMTNRPQGFFALLGEPMRYLASAENFLPPFSWPRLVANGAFLILNGRPQHAGAFIQRLAMSKNVGPAAYWMVAKLLSLVDRKVSAKVAQRGLAEFERTGLRKDVEFIVTVKPVRRAANAIITALARVDAEGLLTFYGLLPKEDSIKARKAITFLKTSKDSEQMLKSLLDDHVVPMLSPHVTKALTELKG